MIEDAVDFRFLLLENYKKLKLNEDELAVILMIDHLLSQGNQFIVADLLSLKMTLNVKKIDDILANLLQKDIISYISKSNKTITSLEPLRKKLYREFELSIANEKLNSKNDRSKIVDNVYTKFETLMGRSLSPVELSKIQEWVSFGYSDQLIIDALKEALSKNKKSLRSVDKILLNWQKREDLETDGVTPINNEWDKNLEETIRIAKVPWIKND